MLICLFVLAWLDNWLSWKKKIKSDTQEFEDDIPLTISDRVSRGGSDAPDNLQLLCAACNSTKGNRTQDELIQSLRDQGVIREDIQEY